MQYLYIASMTGFSGKSLITLGLGLLLKEAGYSIGYIKPFGKIPMKYNDQAVDADADFMRKALSIEAPPDIVSPFVLTFEAQNSVLDGKPSDNYEKIKNALTSIQDKDIVLIGGAADLFEGTLFGINSLKIISHLNARTLVVEPWNSESSIDSILGAKELMGDNFLGAVINKIPESAHDFIKKSVRPFLENKGIPVFAALHRDILLDSITVRRLNEVLNGKIVCCEDKIDEFIENFSIGAMDVDNALKHFRRTPNKAVITGASRSDIQLAALETSTRCIVLTGGMHTNDVIIGKAQMEGVPIISTNEDTYATVEKIESVLGKIRIREQKKVLKTKELVGNEFDFQKLLSMMGLRK